MKLGILKMSIVHFVLLVRFGMRNGDAVRLLVIEQLF